MALVTGYFFADEARTFVERETPGWRAWLEGLAVKPAEPGCPLPSGPGGERLRSDIVRPRTEEER